jgi:TolB-like protein/DNA-binding winged helix-turn-helix (wHTH) protein/tetratricopeptide (TPR) repeat protein
MTGMVMRKQAGTALVPHAIFEFADLTLDTRQRAVSRGTQRIALPKLTYELLLALVEAAPELLTPDELIERVWRGCVATPETLAQRVLLLRGALGDDASSPRYLRGVRGHGYQLVPPVIAHHLRDSRSLRHRTGADQQPERFDGVSSVIVDDIDLSMPAQPSLVVLPFDAVDDDDEQANFARGLTHDIMTRVARTRSFFVIARGTAFRFGRGPHDVRDVGRKLGVRYVLQGYILLTSFGIKINVALADAVDGREIWAEQFHRKLENVFEMQEEITDLVVGAISTEVELAEQQRALLETPANLDAWSAYHRGCWHMYRFTPADYEQAQRFFDISLRLDPYSSRTLAGMSFVHWQRAFLEISADRPAEIKRAHDLAQQSVSINPCDPLAHWALGRAYFLRGEMSESITELATSAALNPSFAVGQYTLGFALMHAGDLTQSIVMADKARRLSPYDPMSFAMIGVRAFSLAMAGEYDQGARLMAVSIRQPNAHYHMVAMAAVCDALAGHEETARRNLRGLLQAKPGYDVNDFLRAFPFQQPAHRDRISSAFRRLGHWS